MPSVLAQVFSHAGDVVWVVVGSRVESAGVIVARIGQALIHHLMGVPRVGAGVHFWPVGVGGAGKSTEMRGGGRLGTEGAGCNNGRAFVRSVRVLLHVLGQVGLLGVALPAVGADVGLKVLGLLVLGDVFQQRDFVMETFVA